MIQDIFKTYWVTGAATAAMVATAAYLVLGSSSDKCKSKKYEDKKKKILPSGLVNEGSTCFINTTLQALASCQIFLYWMENLLIRKGEFLSPESLCAHLLTTMSGK